MEAGYSRRDGPEMSNQLWDSRDTQFCGGCGVYHYRDECDCPYFNDEFNWR